MISLRDNDVICRTKFLSDDWMLERQFIEPKQSAADQPWWFSLPTSTLNLKAPLTINKDVTIHETLMLLDKEGFDQVPVVSEDGCVCFSYISLLV